MVIFKTNFLKKRLFRTEKQTSDLPNVSRRILDRLCYTRLSVDVENATFGQDKKTGTERLQYIILLCQNTYRNGKTKFRRENLSYGQRGIVLRTTNYFPITIEIIEIVPTTSNQVKVVCAAEEILCA